MSTSCSSHALPFLALRRTRLWLLLVGGITTGLVGLHFFPLSSASEPTMLGISPIAVLAIFLAALACEFMDSSLGMGYGTTLTPLLLLVHFGPLQIVPAVLLSELVTGVAAGVLHQRDGNVDFLKNVHARRTVLLLGSLSTVGALLAAWVAVSIPRFWLNLAITTIIIAMGVIILLTRKRRIPYRPVGIAVVGAVAAFNKGLSGGGYGPLVTSGQMVAGLPAKHAVAITSVAESVACLVGLLGYRAMGMGIAWELAIPMALGALLSVPMATLAVSRSSEASLRGVVGVVTLVLGAVAVVELF
ncbi:sulfite exporter TauE/SafE family protein [Accumulibacter sp.]|uniref:sulfite exporter TauE/SafE family protein n=1 Tax=Accumulibacter sp. TaxID=2053492 RepID=UPI0025D21DBB|nr:sulfite exporter TauE/SafE family protein [Accumulibacter sp.]MCM8595340.1 sulfite exporter TauE/SafE family protein [Accumulibacter sp.]MCM8625317.1 sulfite exporter TauE/SafE family protein [Accumulibacter sp.]MDS4049487.1 sulfite exporter TauE/SafE family protein [Accumulibacter sp.]